MVQNGHETKSVPFKTKLYVCCMLTEEGLKVGVQVQLHRAPAPPACPTPPSCCDGLWLSHGRN